MPFSIYFCNTVDKLALNRSTSPSSRTRTYHRG